MSYSYIIISIYTFVTTGLLFSFCLYSDKQKKQINNLQQHISDIEPKYTLFEDDDIL